MKITDKSIKFRHTKIIEQAVEYFMKHEAPCDVVFAKGDRTEFAKEIIDEAISNKCDLITIMHRPNKAFKAIDSLDKALIFNQLKIPVLCVNPQDLCIGGGIA